MIFKLQETEQIINEVMQKTQKTAQNVVLKQELKQKTFIYITYIHSNLLSLVLFKVVCEKTLSTQIRLKRRRRLHLTCFFF